ncbi:hypothetical protein [Janibacter sp. G56]|uniref:hypothetical protein n=1 Tax=Janibacter sp. G56 TaxID=3418717 RepID=UPI003D02F232
MTTKTTQADGKKTAGAFDIRNIIGLLLGIYGVILTLMGLLGDAEPAKTGGTNANLWTGLALLIAAAVFVIWTKARPIVVPAEVEKPLPDPTRPGPTTRSGAKKKR